MMVYSSRVKRDTRAITGVFSRFSCHVLKTKVRLLLSMTCSLFLCHYYCNAWNLNSNHPSILLAPRRESTTTMSIWRHRELTQQQRRQWRKICMTADWQRQQEEIPSSGQPPLLVVIRDAQEQDMAKASTIVADGDDNQRNFFSGAIERFETYATLTSSFQTYRFANGDNIRFRMLVALIATSSKEEGDDGEEVIIGFCQVDDCMPKGEMNPDPRPYLSNLAIDSQYRRQGYGKKLLEKCESIVRDEWNQEYLYLRTEESNVISRSMYSSCGYQVQSSKFDNAKKETTFLYRKSLH